METILWDWGCFVEQWLSNRITAHFAEIIKLPETVI